MAKPCAEVLIMVHRVIGYLRLHGKGSAISTEASVLGAWCLPQYVISLKPDISHSWSLSSTEYRLGQGLLSIGLVCEACLRNARASASENSF